MVVSAVSANKKKSFALASSYIPTHHEKLTLQIKYTAYMRANCLYQRLLIFGGYDLALGVYFVYCMTSAGATN